MSGIAGSGGGTPKGKSLIGISASSFKSKSQLKAAASKKRSGTLQQKSIIREVLEQRVQAGGEDSRSYHLILHLAGRLERHYKLHDTLLIQREELLLHAFELHVSPLVERYGEKTNDGDMSKSQLREKHRKKINAGFCHFFVAVLYALSSQPSRPPKPRGKNEDEYSEPYLSDTEKIKGAWETNRWAYILNLVSRRAKIANDREDIENFRSVIDTYLEVSGLGGEICVPSPAGMVMLRMRDDLRTHIRVCPNDPFLLLTGLHPSETVVKAMMPIDVANLRRSFPTKSLSGSAGEVNTPSRSKKKDRGKEKGKDKKDKREKREKKDKGGSDKGDLASSPDTPDPHNEWTNLGFEWSQVEFVEHVFRWERIGRGDPNGAVLDIIRVADTLRRSFPVVNPVLVKVSALSDSSQYLNESLCGAVEGAVSPEGSNYVFANIMGFIDDNQLGIVVSPMSENDSVIYVDPQDVFSIHPNSFENTKLQTLAWNPLSLLYETVSLTIENEIQHCMRTSGVDLAVYERALEMTITADDRRDQRRRLQTLARKNASSSSTLQGPNLKDLRDVQRALLRILQVNGNATEHFLPCVEAASSAAVKWISFVYPGTIPLATVSTTLNQIFQFCSKIDYKAAVEGRYMAETMQLYLDLLLARVQDVLSGTRKAEVSSWWLEHIEQSVSVYVKQLGVDESALPRDYTNCPPDDLDALNANLDIIRKTMEPGNRVTIEFVDRIADEVYKVIMDFIEEINTVLDYKWIHQTHNTHSLREDLGYLTKMFEMDQKIVNDRKNEKFTPQGIQMTDVVPVRGLIMARFHIMECEIRTALELWDSNMSSSSLSDPSGVSDVAVSDNLQRRSLLPRPPGISSYNSSGEDTVQEKIQWNAMMRTSVMNLRFGSGEDETAKGNEGSPLQWRGTGNLPDREEAGTAGMHRSTFGQDTTATSKRASGSLYVQATGFASPAALARYCGVDRGAQGFLCVPAGSQDELEDFDESFSSVAPMQLGDPPEPPSE